MQLTRTKKATPVALSGGSGAAKGMDFLGVILFFMGAGWGLDRAFGTKPLFMVGLIILGFIGQMARTWYAYDADMREHESKLGHKS
jgi:F0F1-type ATP synthase assembly protein I